MNHYAAIDACAHYKRFAPPVALVLTVSAIASILTGGL